MVLCELENSTLMKSEKDPRKEKARSQFLGDWQQENVGDSVSEYRLLQIHFFKKFVGAKAAEDCPHPVYVYVTGGENYLTGLLRYEMHKKGYIHGAKSLPFYLHWTSGDMSSHRLIIVNDENDKLSHFATMETIELFEKDQSYLGKDNDNLLKLCNSNEVRVRLSCINCNENHKQKIFSARGVRVRIEKWQKCHTFKNVEIPITYYV